MTLTADIDNTAFVYRPFTGKIRVTQHAIDRAVERLGAERASAEQTIRDNMKKATFVSYILNEEGRHNRLFTYQRVAYILAADIDLVVTLFKQHYAPAAITQQVRKVLDRELAKAVRKEKAAERRVAVAKAKLDVEAAQCRYKMTVTPSKAVIATNTERLAQIDVRLTALDGELTAARRAKSDIARGMVPFM